MPRWLEVLLALSGLVALSPLLALIAIAVGFSSRGPILFRQQRIGLHGRPFELVKFRSMRPETSAPAASVTASGDPRITTVGTILRATKLDELPELWNILRGDMSFVGPRPEVPRHVDLCDPLWQAVVQVRPGLTDPTTLLLRSEERLIAELVKTSGPPATADSVYRRRLLPIKLRLSIRYIERRSVLSDLGVIARTLLAIVLPAAPPSFEALEDLLVD